MCQLHSCAVHIVINIIIIFQLLFLHAHRETTRYFEILDDERAQPSHGSPTAAPLASSSSSTISRTRLVGAWSSPVYHTEAGSDAEPKTLFSQEPPLNLSDMSPSLLRRKTHFLHHLLVRLRRLSLTMWFIMLISNSTSWRN